MIVTLVQEDGGIQKLVYYVSKALIDTQTRYTRFEKLVFALFVAMRELKHYFQSFLVVVPIEYPLRTIVENPEANGKITRWVIEIWPLRIIFEPRTTIKGQILVDSIVEFTPRPPSHDNFLKGWILNMNRVSNGKGTRVGVVHTTPDGSIIE